MIRCWSQSRSRAGWLQDNKHIFHSIVNTCAREPRLRSALQSIYFVITHLTDHNCLHRDNYELKKINLQMSWLLLATFSDTQSKL